MSIPQSGGGPIEHRDQLAKYMEQGCKPKVAWRIGTEHEKFGYTLKDHRPISYHGDASLKAMLEGLRDGFGWSPLAEAGNIIGLEKDGANISLEPGGQLELSGGALETIHQTCDEVNTHLCEVREVADRLGIGFIGLGVAPEWHHADMPVMPKGRYKLMTRYMGEVGTQGTQMMYRTCTVQVNLDFASEVDMVNKFRVALALQPVATALFANSPFFEGKPNGHRSWRAKVWQNLDDARTGMLPFVFEDGMGFERYADFALQVPMYFVYRDGVYHDALGQDFRQFLNGKLPALLGETPTLSDWADHLTTIFPEARIKKYMEMRGADSGPWRRLCALPAFWVGLLYDQTALDAAWDIAKGWDAETRDQLRRDAGQFGLRASVNGMPLLEIASQCLAVAHEGLKARAKPSAGGLLTDETHFLNALHEIVEREETPADEILRRYETEWDRSFGPLYAEYSY